MQLEEAHSLDEVRNFHMLLIPRPPEFAAAAEKAEQSTGIKGKPDPEKSEEAEMKVLEPGADVIPSQPSLDQAKQQYRLVTIGKKHLPDPEKIGTRGGRKEVFWATVTALGDNLDELRSGLGPKEYETKTRGERPFTTSMIMCTQQLRQARVMKLLVALQVVGHTQLSTQKLLLPRSEQLTSGIIFHIHLQKN